MSVFSTSRELFVFDPSANHQFNYIKPSHHLASPVPIPIHRGTRTESFDGRTVMRVATSLRLQLVQQDGIAFAVQTHRHSTDGAVHDIALESDALALEVSH
jgi:hypothetical protein